MSQALNLEPVQDMSVEAFLDWSAQHDGKWQLVDGNPLAMAPPGSAHGRIQAETARVLGNWLSVHRPGCAVVIEGGLIPRVSASNNYRVPDLVVTCAPDIEGTRDVKAPILVVEILSPSNQAQTWINLWAYASMPSVMEMLVLQSESIGAQLFRREPDLSWPTLASRLGQAADLTLESIGLTVPVSAFYRTTRFAQA